MAIQTYQDALDWLYSFVRFDVGAHSVPSESTLARMERLLELLGSPQSNFPCILIAGTKGKGSTAAFIANILRCAGYRTGLFTSPHLHTFRERIRVGEALITRAEVISGVQQLQSVVSKVPELNWFQLVTALALARFQQQRVEIAVLEVGLGGRFDPTNVVTPLVSVITSISYDHTEILGNTLAAIASEKAGIIKEGVPVICAPQPGEAAGVIRERAKLQRAPRIQIGRDWKFELLSATLEGQWFRAYPRNTTARRYYIPLLGRHQLTNATCALATTAELKHQGWRVRHADVREGLATVNWHVRFEIISRKPLVVVDGAHNRASARELAHTLRELFPQARIHLVFGASNDKDIEGMFAELLPHASSLTLTRSRHPRAADPLWLGVIAGRYSARVSYTPNIGAALEFAQAEMEANDVLCVTGSLFISAEARAAVLAKKGIQVETDDS